WTNQPSVKWAALRAVNGSSRVTIVPRWGSTSSGWRSAATTIGSTVTPSGTACAGAVSGARSSASGAPGGGAWASRSSLSIGVISQPAMPRKLGSSSVPSASTARARRAVRNCGSWVAVPLPNRALHLQLDQAVHLDRVLHRQLLDDRLDEAVDDQLAGLLL